MVFVSAVVTQAAGLGVALAFFVDIQWSVAVPPVFGAIIAALVATVAFAIRSDRFGIMRESMLGFAYLTSAGAALAVGSAITQEAHDIASILFGTAVLVRPEDLRMVAVCGALVMGIVIWFRRGFLFASFDPDGAAVNGLPVGLLDQALWALLAIMVAVATRALGALPVFAFSVLPAVGALLLAPDLRAAFIIAAVLGALSGFVGYLTAFFANLPVGASQTLVAASLVAVAALVRPFLSIHRR
jgi:zinc transport system permease protein